MQHNLKIDRRWFEAVVGGSKRAEVRRADRDFAVGDELLLYVPHEKEGVLVAITHIVNLPEVDGLDCDEPIAVLSIDSPQRLSGDLLDARLRAGDYGKK